MIMKEIGTYNALWFQAAWKAHELARALQRRVRVKMSGSTPITILLPKE